MTQFLDHPPDEMELYTRTLFVVLAGIAFLILVRTIQQYRERCKFIRLNGCEKPTLESDFRYDFLGIAKAIELGTNFRQKTALLYTNGLFIKYGDTYESNAMGYRLIFTCNANNIKHLLSTGFNDYGSSGLRKPLFETVTPHGIFTVDGSEWRGLRDQMRVQLSNNRRIVDLNMCEEQFQCFLKRVPANGKAFDIQRFFFGLSLDIQTSFTLGDSVNTLSTTQPPEKEQFVEDLLYVKERIVSDGFRGPLRHLSNKINFSRACSRTRKYVMAYAKRALESQKHTESEGTSPGYVYIRGLSSKMTDPLEITDHALSVLLANDSMGTLLSGLFFLLSQNERVVQKLRASIVDSIGYEVPTYDQVAKLHYTRCVLNEALRLFPAATLNARTANKDAILPCGGGVDGNSPVFVKKGGIVVFSTWGSHRLGKDFSEKPEEFIPERWEELRGEVSSFIPFNRGPRVCPGQNYAMIVVAYIVARTFQTFSTVSNYNLRPFTERISMTLENDNGVMVGLS